MSVRFPSAPDLRDLHARLAIRDLVETLAMCADNRDRAGYLALFAEGAEMTVRYADGTGDTRTGAQLVEAPVFAEPPRFVRTLHVTANHVCRLDGDRASAHTYCLAHHLTAKDGGYENFVAHIRYEDDFVRGPDGWRVARRVLIPIFRERRPCDLSLSPT